LRNQSPVQGNISLSRRVPTETKSAGPSLAERRGDDLHNGRF
jgi:hypothetical protein